MQLTKGRITKYTKGSDGLTVGQRELFRFLFETVNQTGRMPTYNDVAQIRGISVFAVSGLLQSLAKKGLVRLPKGKARALEIVGCKVVLICDSTVEGRRARAICEGRPEDIPIECLEKNGL